MEHSSEPRENVKRLKWCSFLALKNFQHEKNYYKKATHKCRKNLNIQNSSVQLLLSHFRTVRIIYPKAASYQPQNAWYSWIHRNWCIRQLKLLFQAFCEKRTRSRKLNKASALATQLSCQANRTELGGSKRQPTEKRRSSEPIRIKNIVNDWMLPLYWHFCCAHCTLTEPKIYRAHTNRTNAQCCEHVFARFGSLTHYTLEFLS